MRTVIPAGRRRHLLVAGALVALLASGCASADTIKYGAPPRPSAAAGASGAGGSAGSGAPAGSGGPGAPAPAPSGGLELTTTADDPLAFHPTTLSAAPGAKVTVTYRNDSPVPHNVAFFNGPDATAPRIAATDVKAGPGDVESVSFTAPDQPGSYFFHCDVHPDQMQGTLTVG
ncbi:MAG: plastocyanin/azurin family copper-binding protein [Chloroflexota bacterium]